MPMNKVGSILMIASYLLVTSGAINAQILPRSIPTFSNTDADGLNLAQAEYTSALVAKHEGYNVRDKYAYIERLTDEGDRKSDPFPGFFYFGIARQMPDAPSINHLHVYYVSKQTGDVWESATPSPLKCRRVSFPELRIIQAQIMKRTGSTFKTERSQRLGIGCTGE